MKVFISWSGQTSHHVAQALYNWFPKVIQTIEPFLSNEICFALESGALRKMAFSFFLFDRFWFGLERLLMRVK